MSGATEGRGVNEGVVGGVSYAAHSTHNQRRVES